MKRAGVMGWPVEHSRSPVLHGFWLKQYNIDGEYVLLPVRPEELATALRGLAARGFAGCNLTIPHKEAALAIVDRVDATARRIGAVNTVIVRSEGSLEGRNTDAFGFYSNLKTALPNWCADAGPAVVLGAGGGGRAVVAALLDNGAPEVRLVNRHRDRAAALAAALGGRIEVVDWARREDALAGAALLVNTTSLGMAGQPPLDLALDALPAHAAVNDIVYVPMETPLLAAARKRGNPVVDGLGMLLHQARPGFAAWFGVMPEVTPALRQAVMAGLAKR
ncbi:MAG TPA: shikimate dehydrogenase [Stellaceae bacterium]